MKKRTDTATLPNRIREMRLAREWTLEYLANELETSITQISLLETGKRTLTQKWMRRIARIFAVSPAELLGEDDNPLGLTPGERLLIDRYRHASPESRAALDRVSEALMPYTAEPPQDNGTDRRAA